MLLSREIVQHLSPHFGEKGAKALSEVFENFVWSQVRAEFEEIRDILKELAQAQARTEARLEELAQAQADTERQLGETQKALKSLARTVEDLQKQVGGITHTIGYTLENEAYKALPELLKRDLGVQVQGKLLRKMWERSRGAVEEVDIFGEGLKDGRKVVILGEVQAQLSKRHLDRFLKRLERLKKELPEGERILVAVTHSAPPSVVKYAEEKGIRVYHSYEL